MLNIRIKLISNPKDIWEIEHVNWLIVILFYLFYDNYQIKSFALFINY